MAKKKNNIFKKEKVKDRSFLPKSIKGYLLSLILFLSAAIILFSFFNLAGKGGQQILAGLLFLFGKAAYILPLFFVLSATIFFIGSHNIQRVLKMTAFAFLLCLFGLSAILNSFGAIEKISLKAKPLGGFLGYFLGFPVLKFFGFWVNLVVFGSLLAFGFLIFWQISKKIEPKTAEELAEKNQILKRILEPKLKIREIPGLRQSLPSKDKETSLVDLKTKPIPGFQGIYKKPSLDLLEPEKGEPVAGDIRNNMMIIKNTLENFDIPVEMGEVNVGPTVTQYTLKPSEGIKLSKITTLNSDLSLALATHPIRIEAPIPGKSLVGIEVPNSSRTIVRLKNLFEDTAFKNSAAPLLFSLGRDVAGIPAFADLSRMPHLLVAGATGTGKTCARDTLMFTEKGMLTFEELCPLSLNSETDFKLKLVTRDGIETTSKNYNNGICQFYKLSTNRGFQIEATAEHPLWVINEDGVQGWKPASLIKKGDSVAISRAPSLFGNKIDLSNFQPSKIKAYHRKISFPSKMTSQLAQFLGFLSADGGLSVEGKGLHRITYTQADPRLLSLYKKSLKQLFGITRFIEKRSGSNPKNKAKDIEVNSKHLKEFLAYLGMDSWKSPQKEMPRAIREASKEIVAAYLRAFFDNDGYVGKDSIELCISSKKLVSHVHLMLLNFGIVSSLTIKKVKNYAHNEYYKLPILGQEARKFIKEIGFIRKEKYDKVKEFLKLFPNPNVDLIPHLSSLLRRMGQKYLTRFARLTNRGWKYQSGILVPKYAFSSLRSYNSGFRAPGYQGLEKILDFYQPISQEPEYQELEKISERNFYWDKIKKIEKTSGVGYDFRVPGSDSFVGNGFVNHNTICLNSILLSLLYRNSPETMRLIMVDPKRVEFPVYQEIPHLLSPVIYDVQKTVNALKWLVKEMERRFEVLASAKTRNIASYNKDMNQRMAKAGNSANQEKEGLELMPYIIVIIDELADLIAARGKEIEAGIVRLAQMARAVGIHLIVATQRPSVEVITGLIKANITSRITFQVASQIDSRTVIDGAGAEKLLGAGDMLFISPDIGKPRRIQGAYVAEKEVKRVTDFLRSQKQDFSLLKENFLAEELARELTGLAGSTGLTGAEEFFSSDTEDPLYLQAKQLAIEYKKASASLMQRRLRIGYARAARLLDILEERGVVGPADGARPREVYIKEENSLKANVPMPNSEDETESDENNDDWEKV